MNYISITLPLFITPGQCILCATFEHKLYIEHINAGRKAKNKQNTLTIVVPLRTVILYLLYLATKSYTLETVMTSFIVSTNTTKISLK